MSQKKPFHYGIRILAGLLLVMSTGLPSYAQDSGPAVVREETTILENLYQEKVRTILNNLMNPEDYTLVISATMKNDDKKLRDYGDLVEKKFLPGLPINDPSAYSDANNMLLDLKQKVDIQVILTDNVPGDRDTIVRDILKSKLHLSEESGDSITVVRAARIVAPPGAGEHPKLPELSVKMIAFWIFVTMMLLTGFLLWLQKRRERQREQERAEQALLIEQRKAQEKAIEEAKQEQ
ncbi:MAG: hypothetical protein EBX52_03665, partial [Proteobacteria bacterium]|nr:hypothetical protein [Pseudomonadota bacterium]